MLHVLREAPTATPARTAAPTLSSRRSAPRLRALFLRHFRKSGEVRAAARQAGVARSTLYRWREKDARFRARWESYDEQRRHEAEDYLVRLMRDGEKTAVFHKGQQVGWRASFTVRPASALLASQDRREKMRLMAQAREEKRALVSQSGRRFQAESPVASKGWQEKDPRKNGDAANEERIAESAGAPPAAAAPVPDSSPGPSSEHLSSEQPAQEEQRALVSRSNARSPAENRVVSGAWVAVDSRKIPGPRKTLPSVPHRLRDDWKLPKAARRPAAPFEPGPIRHADRMTLRVLATSGARG